MGTPLCGRLAYAYVGTSAMVNLKGWQFTATNSIMDVDNDISSNWQTRCRGFMSGRGSISFNLTSDDFNDLWDAVTAGSAVALYLYTSSASTSIYLYGSAFLTDINSTANVNQTVSGDVNFSTNGTWARQTTA
jgi:hypothetical protein